MSTQLPQCVDWTPASGPRPAVGGSSPTNIPVFPPSSFILLGFAWVCIFFSTSQVLLSTLSWCSVCTSVSEVIFLVSLWKEMYSTSTYSSAILFSQILSFKPTFSLSSFTFIKRFFSSSLLSAIRVVSSAYLSLLIFLMAILIPVCASSSPAFHMMYFAYG